MSLKKAYIKPIIGGRQLFIGDVHGCVITLKTLLRKINLQKSDQLIFLGDLINKGPDSCGVVDCILELQASDFEVYVIRGNNESLLLKVLKKNEERIERLASRFGIIPLFKRDQWKLKKKYRIFFKSTLHYIESDSFYAVHAGFDYKSEDPFNDTFPMLWMRNFKANKTLQSLKPVLHGHRVLPIKKIRKSIKKEKFNLPLDNGCVLGNEDKDYGRLLCFDLSNRILYEEEYAELSE
jgi:serine/threonine protein phosphatase 1